MMKPIPASLFKPMMTVFLLLFLSVSTSVAETRFIDNGDGTVSDMQTGLMWSRSDNRKDVYVADAEQYLQQALPQSLTSPYNDWRLPTLEELKTLVVENKAYRGVETPCGSVARIQPVFDLSCVLIWSSDTSLGTPLIYNFRLLESFTVMRSEIEGCRILGVRRFQPASQ